MFASCSLPGAPFESCCSLCSHFFSNLVISRESNSIVCSSPELSSKVGISARLCALASSAIFPWALCISAETWSDISTQAGGRFIVVIPALQHAPPFMPQWLLSVHKLHSLTSHLALTYISAQPQIIQQASMSTEHWSTAEPRLTILHFTPCHC